MASENEAQPETEEEDTKENEAIKVEEEGTGKTDDDVKDFDKKDSSIVEPDTHDETQEYMEAPDRVDSEDSAIAEHEKEAEPDQPAADDMKTSSKMSMEIVTQKRMTVEQSARRSSLPKTETVTYEKSKDRFASLAKTALGSTIDIRHLGESGPVGERRTVRYGNNYRMEAENPFNPGKVDKILKKVIEETLENLTYDVEKCSNHAKWASTAIRSKVKKLNFDRYKIICLVTIGEKHSQDVLATCRFLWDAEKDGYAAVSLENTYVFAIAQCFGLYYE